MDTLIQQIILLADKYAATLDKKVSERIEEMKQDDITHYLIYRVLGITHIEGNLIDLYQNKGRFLYKYAGAFLEEAAILCFKYKFPEAKKVTVLNNLGSKPKTFEIDCLVNVNAFEIKWRDATTDGDHITKEHTRVKVIQSYGYKPIRLMFYFPNREQAMKIQYTLQTLYQGVNGEYIYGENAWQYIKATTEIDLRQILVDIVELRKLSGGL